MADHAPGVGGVFEGVSSCPALGCPCDSLFPNIRGKAPTGHQDRRHRMRTLPYSILASIAVTLMAGCSMPVLVELHNNTPDTIFVSVAKKRFAVPASSRIRFEPGFDDRASFLVTIGARDNGYQIRGIEIPKQFCSHKRGCADLYLQLQSDLKIYIVEPGSSFPVRNLPEQPTGFPLVPVHPIE